MKLGVLGEGPGRGWGTRKNDESGNDIGGLRRRPRGHAPPYSLFFLVLDLGPPPVPPSPHPPVMASPWFLRAPPPLLPALSSLSLLAICLLVSLHARLLRKAGCGWGGGKFRGGVRSAESRGLLPRGAGEGREDHRAVLGPWKVGRWETPVLLFTHLAPRPWICHR